MKKKNTLPDTGFIPPLNIHRSSDEVDMVFVGEVKNASGKLYQYKYLNGLLKNNTVEYSEQEMLKQLSNYWGLKN